MSDMIERSIVLAQPIDRVWRAIADHREFGAWFGVAIDAPFALGEASTGRLTYPCYEHVRWHAQIVAIDPPRLFAYTWHPYANDPAVDYSSEPQTRVEFRLVPEGEGTRLTVIESGFDALPAARRADALRANGNGWTTQIGNIRSHVGG